MNIAYHHVEKRPNFLLMIKTRKWKKQQFFTSLASTENSNFIANDFSIDPYQKVKIAHYHLGQLNCPVSKINLQVQYAWFSRGGSHNMTDRHTKYCNPWCTCAKTPMLYIEFTLSDLWPKKPTHSVDVFVRFKRYDQTGIQLDEYKNNLCLWLTWMEKEISGAHEPPQGGTQVNNIKLLHTPSLNSINYYYPRCGYSTRLKAEWNILTECNNKHAIQRRSVQ